MELKQYSAWYEAKDRWVMAVARKRNTFDVFLLLPILAVCVDLFTPYLIWIGVLPAQLRWGSHAALAAMILVSIFRMLGYNRIPLSFLAIACISVFWSYIAIGHGQGLASTVWGVWLLFQFPFVYLFMVLQPEPTKGLPEYLRLFCISILVIEVVFQIVQFVSGVVPGDDLSGLFGRNGTGNLVLFDLLVCCILFGDWIMTRKPFGLLAGLALSLLSSVLGEMKLFPVAVPLIGLISVVIYAAKYRSPGKMFAYLSMIVVTLFVFASLYNMIVPEAGNSDASLQSYITNPAKLMKYLNQAQSYAKGEDVYTDIGRGFAVQLGWKSIQKDALTFLFGYGVGTRSESQALGTAGLALTTDYLGMSVGTSLLVIMQEMGVVGLALLAGFILWTIFALARDIRSDPGSSALGLRYALIFFSILWPLWLWYAVTWTMRVPMLLYWFSLGYVFAESRLTRKKLTRSPAMKTFKWREA
ncbi:MAG TPA: hypothetical protein PK414_02300 [Anaerolineales bacterium]|nr:hypothetical protein [Anaerolineales bacterium]